MNHKDWVHRHYAEGTDALNSEVFVDGLSEDVQFAGGGRKTVGRDAARTRLEQMATDGLIAMMHQIKSLWEPEAHLVISEADVTYTTARGPLPVLPVVTIFRWVGDEVSQVHVFMDAAFGGLAPESS